MVKYCPKCGASNTDDANFCVSCGARIPSLSSIEAVPNVPQKNDNNQSTSGISMESTAASQNPSMAKKSAIERSFEKFFENLNLMIPVIILFLITIVVNVIAVFTVIENTYFAYAGGVVGLIATFIISFLFGPIIFIVSHESALALKKQPYSLSDSFNAIKSSAVVLIYLSLLMAVISTFFRLIPFFGEFLMALTVSYFIPVFLEPVDINAIKRPIKIFSEMQKKDTISLVAVIILGIISYVPLLNIFTIPVTVLTFHIFQE